MSERTYRSGIAYGALAFSVLSFVFYQITYSPLSGGIVDDFVHYSMAGFLGVEKIRGASDLPRHIEGFFRIERAIRAEGLDPSIWQAFIFSGVPYSPVMVLLSAVERALEPLRAALGLSFPLWWAGFYYVVWLGMFAGLVRALYRGRGAIDVAWFLFSGIFLAAVYFDGPPFLPAPRGVTILCTGVALHLLAQDPASRLARLLLAAAPFFHPFQQAINLEVAIVFIWIWAPQRIRISGLILWVLVPMGISFLLVSWMTLPEIYAVWTGPPLLPRDPVDATGASWQAFKRTFRIWLAFIGFFWALRGARKAAIFTIAFFAMLVVPLAVSPIKAEHFILRPADAWLAVGLYLLLRVNGFAKLADVGKRWRVFAAAGFALAAMFVLVVYWRGFNCANSLSYAPFGDRPLALGSKDYHTIRFLEERIK